MREKMGILRMKIEWIVYRIKKKICDLMYRRVTYIPEKGVWVSTVVFPFELSDGICGMTDVFSGNDKKVDFEPLHTVWIKKISDAVNIHRDMVNCARKGYILKNEVKIV